LKSVRIIAFAFLLIVASRKRRTEEKSIVTGDLNAALVDWVVKYRIEDPRQYLFDVRNPGGNPPRLYAVRRGNYKYFAV
jgi:regulator of protease activity HflC (stomatin/prohibitin superfamily)